MEVGDLSTCRKQRKSCLNENMVSSRGCSRYFIIVVLRRALDYCKSLPHAPDFPFSRNVIQIWLDEAKLACETSTTTLPLGGIVFSPTDSTSYWTVPKQFLTWWKNNIERKSKFLTLQRDAITVTSEKSLLR